MRRVASTVGLVLVAAACGSDVARGRGTDATNTPAQQEPDAGGGSVDPAPDAGLTVSAKRTLTDDDRRAFLRYYAPVILKRSSESNTRMGRDWMTSYDFDRDAQFSDNKANWEALQSYVTGGMHPEWTIRPTLYSAFIEFKTGERRDAILLFHVYHAKEEGSIHDWERIELRLNGIGKAPGGAEDIRYAVVTEHSKHNSRTTADPDMNFMVTPTGKHLLAWQAQETNGIVGFFRAEIHFVEETWASIQGRTSTDSAKVDVNGGDAQAFHYAFVPDGDPNAVTAWNAQSISQANAQEQSAGTAATVTMGEVKRIAYELQDLADILPTHWSGGFVSRHWEAPDIQILLDEELASGLDLGPSVTKGLQLFRAGSIDSEDANEDANGYPVKHWFWGAYRLGGQSMFAEAFELGTPLGGRATANGDPGSLNAYMHQHDYFAHGGTRTDGSSDTEDGVWLPLGWSTAEADGFDGRWVQLFPN